MPEENIKLKQFLLGNLPENEADEIGVRIISDESFEDKMFFAEEELIEDFLEDLLSAEEKELFYENFLTTRERVELFEETALFKKYAQTNFVKPKVETTEEKKPASFFETLKNFFALNHLRPVAAVLIVLVIGAIAWRVFLYDGGGLTQIEKDYAALNQKDLSNPSETANLSNKSLIAGAFRDANSAAKLTAESLTENVFLRLALPSAAAPETVYDLELLKDEKTVFRQNNLRLYQNQSGQEVKVILPKAVLAKGQYQIKLTNTSNKDSIIGYSLAVE